MEKTCVEVCKKAVFRRRTTECVGGDILLVTTGLECSAYPVSGIAFRRRQGYCPVADVYFDKDKQAAYVKSKLETRKKKVGQQKQVKVK